MAGRRRPFLLASAPVELLDRAIPRCLAWGGDYSAGDATDKLNSSVIGQGCGIYSFAGVSKLCPPAGLPAVRTPRFHSDTYVE
jgi:hypothetical protein